MTAATNCWAICLVSVFGPLACSDTTTNPPVATRLVFTAQPNNVVVAGAPISPALQVTARDALGNTVTSFAGNVTIAIGNNPGGSMLSGTTSVAAMNGIATFAELSIDKSGSGYTLTAASDAIMGVSAPFETIRLISNAIGTGAGHTCGLTSAGSAYCWGLNSSGQLGDGTTTNRLTPTLVSSVLSFTALSVGSASTCGLTSGGAAYCWGGAYVGDGTTNSRSSPVAVSGGRSFTALSVRGAHKCGLTSGGAAYCWGVNSYGQLGDGTTTTRLVPVIVSGGLAFAELSAGLVATGAGHTCGLTSAGVAYCWGRNASGGQLGDGGTSDRSAPGAVSGGLTFRELRAGGYHTCGLTKDVLAYCWGSSDDGQLGNGSMSQRTAPTRVSGAFGFATLSSGQNHTCGVTSGASMYCWGDNTSGQLGDGTTTRRATPTLVSGGLTISGLSAGYSHTCGLTSVGTAYCWGRNQHGELGDGTTTDRFTPVLVLGGLSFASVTGALGRTERP
jgi:alpha-tubulin suppressor-like RCC1 family protein